MAKKTFDLRTSVQSVIDGLKAEPEKIRFSYFDKLAKAILAIDARLSKIEAGAGQK